MRKTHVRTMKGMLKKPARHITEKLEEIREANIAEGHEDQSYSGMLLAGEVGSRLDTRETEANPLPSLFAGIQFRNAKHKDELATRIVNELASTRRETRQAQQHRHDEETKALYAQIARLEDALQLEQDRHRADIFAFASGHRRSMSDLVEAAAMQYRPALAS